VAAHPATPLATAVFIGLGANLGNARETLMRALGDLKSHPQIGNLYCSHFYRSAPVDSNGPDYVNAVAQLHTTLAPHALLNVLQAIELKYGRERPYRNAPRTLDLDLLLYGSERVNTPDLTLPHPRMHERAFVLAPLSELAPDLVLDQGDLPALLAHCADQLLQRLPE
jgi:2-amino-4-hydroxy-6-hydroxymethyldihydropteridine diphosphokinase